jgi:hypothetical protein
MSKVRDISNLSNVIRIDASGNVTFVSGSTTLATINTSGQLSGSSPVLSSSYALNATSASYALSASNATNAVTASFANAFTVANTLTATTLVVQTVSSSVIYSSGSNVFGNNIANTHMMTGSLLISGSVGIGTTPVARLEIKQANSLDYRGLLVVDSATPNWIGLAHTGTTGVISVGYDGAGAYYPMVFKTGDTERMRITSTGNVGIGTSSTSAKTEIRGNGNTAINSAGTLFVTSGGTATQTAEVGGQISFGAWLNGDLGQPYPVAAIKGVTESSVTDTNKGALVFATMNSTVNAERMRITSGGIVTKPYQPAFSVYQVSQNGGSGIMTYSTTILNRGNCVNLTNGRFTAPVAGAYQLTFMAFQQNGNTDVLSCVFYINGANSVVRTYQNDSDTGYGPHQTLSAVLSLAANDYVYVNVTSGTIHGNEDGFFSGFLIG